MDPGLPAHQAAQTVEHREHSKRWWDAVAAVLAMGEEFPPVRSIRCPDPYPFDGAWASSVGVARVVSDLHARARTREKAERARLERDLAAAHRARDRAAELSRRLEAELAAERAAGAESHVAPVGAPSAPAAPGEAREVRSARGAVARQVRRVRRRLSRR
jgi:hypothetical protein